MTRFAAAVALLAAALAPARAQEKKDGAPPTLPGLEKKITLEADATLKEHLELFEKASGLRILVQGEEDLDLTRKIDLRLRDTAAATVLRWITRLHQAGSRVSDEGVILVTGRAGGRDPLVRRTYAPRVLGRSGPDLPGGRIDLPDARETGIRITPVPKPAEGEEGGCPITESIIDLLKENVAPGTWEGEQIIDRDGQGRLLVVAPARVQAQIERVLPMLDSIPDPTVTVSATIADAAGAAAPLLDKGLPRVVAPGDLEATLAALRTGAALEGQVSACTGRRVHSLTNRQENTPVAYLRGKAVAKARVAEAGLLDILPSVDGGGRSVRIDLRLSLGQSRDLEAASTPSGPLALQDRLVTRLSTTVVVPSGGAVLLALPARDRTRPVPQLCLLRADAGKPAPEVPRARVVIPDPAPDPDPTRVADRFAKVPAADLDFRDAPISEVLAWVRRLGFNAVLDPSLAQEKVSLRVKSLAPAAALTLLARSRKWDVEIGDDAIFLGPLTGVRRPIRLMILDARDAMGAPGDFGREKEELNACSFEDLCNILKNTIHKNEWEEADGKSLQTHRGFLFIRNTDAMLKECEAFVDEQRAPALKRVALHAEILSVPAADVDTATRNRGAQSLLIDAAQRDRILAAGARVERLSWISLQNQQSLLEWERARDAVEDAAGDSAALRACKTLSFLEVRPVLDKDGETFVFSLSYQDQSLAEGEGPALCEVSAKTRVEIPSGRTALFRWTEPAKEGRPARSRLLLLTPTLIP